MKFICDIDKEKYNNFVLNNKKSHFLQSYEWGQFAKKEKNLTPHYVGLVDDSNNLVCTALLLEKKLPFGFSYFYSPRGFVIDFTNQNLVKEFVKEIKNYVKKYKAIFIKIDPDLVINRTSSYEDEHEDYDKNELLKIMKDNGFEHLGFTQKFETMQPRFSYRIDFGKNIDEVINNFSKTTKQRIKKAEDLEIDVTIGDKNDIKDFYKLMRITENRKDFVTHNLNYYETLYDLFNNGSDNISATLFLGKIDIKNVIYKITDELAISTNEKIPLENIENRSKKENSRLKELSLKIEKLNEQLEKYKLFQNEYGDKITLNGHYIVRYGNMAWVLYAGNHNILTDTYSNYKTYMEHIKYFSDKVKIYDQFGTIGKIDKSDPLYGLDEFKKKFGGDYVEFIGEFDLILNKLMYFVFTKLVPIYRNIVKNIAKKKIKNIK